MPYYVYILQSEKDGSYYKGFTENYETRLTQHNAGLSSYTSRKMPWRLVYVEVHEIKKEALKREKNLKRASLERITALINSSKNILGKN